MPGGRVHITTPLIPDLFPHIRVRGRVDFSRFLLGPSTSTRGQSPDESVTLSRHVAGTPTRNRQRRDGITTGRRNGKSHRKKISGCCSAQLEEVLAFCRLGISGLGQMCRGEPEVDVVRLAGVLSSSPIATRTRTPLLGTHNMLNKRRLDTT